MVHEPHTLWPQSAWVSHYAIDSKLAAGHLSACQCAAVDGGLRSHAWQAQERSAPTQRRLAPCPLCKRGLRTSGARSLLQSWHPVQARTVGEHLCRPLLPCLATRAKQQQQDLAAWLPQAIYFGLLSRMPHLT